MALYDLLKKELHSRIKKYSPTAVSTVSLHYSLFRGSLPNLENYPVLSNLDFHWDKCNQIIPGLHLGVIPVSTTSCDFLCGTRYSHSIKKILEIIKEIDPDKPLSLVVSVLLANEMNGEVFKGTTTVSPEDWKAKGINHRRLNMPDGGAKVDNKEAKEIIHEMKKTMDKGGSVYVHCKAGRGRSAMMCAIYLAHYEINPTTKKRFTLDEAIKFVVAKHKQVVLKKGKTKKAAEILNIMEKKSCGNFVRNREFL